MPIQNYPRFLTKASKTAQQSQTGLPIVGTDGTSGDFNALKVNTDGSINVAGGGGDATAFNQTVQIGEAQTSNVHLTTISQNTSVSTGSSSTIANAGQEIISIGASDNDLFSQIVVTSACHLTAYFLITPYVNP